MIYAIENLELYTATYHIDADSLEDAWTRWGKDGKEVDLEFHSFMDEHDEDYEPHIYPLGEIL